MTAYPGVRLALDWGRARIGVAACDRDGMLAYPVETVAAADPWRRLRTLVDEYDPAAVVVGLPRSLSGGNGPAAAYVTAQAAELASRIAPVPVVLSDERLTTVQASQRLRSAGKSAKAQRGIVDMAAAVAILEAVLEAERRGTNATRPVPDHDER